MIEIYDNFLPEHEMRQIEDTMLGADFPWYYNSHKVNHAAADYDHNFQFTHNVYQNYEPHSNFWRELDPVIRRINAMSWLRVKCNLTPITETPITYGFHIDIDDFDGKTAIFYVNDTDGNTLMQRPGRENIISVECKRNRLVVFDSDIRHTGTSCTDQKVRCLINFNFYPSDNFNLSHEDNLRIEKK